MEQRRTHLPPKITQPRDVQPQAALVVAHESSAAHESSVTREALVSLPQNLESAQALIGQLAASLSTLQDSRQQLAQEVEELKLLVAKLILRLAGDRSERLADDPNQLKLDFQDDTEARDVLAEASAEAEHVIQEYLVRRKLAQPQPARHE